MSSARRGGIDSLILKSGGAGNPQVFSGTADPSAGGGVAAPEGSVYVRYGAGAGQLWVKTGAADTGWSQGGAPPPLPTADIAGGYDASDIDNVRFPGLSGNGQPIDTWYDTLSGSFRDMTEGGIPAQRPTWVDNVQNGLAVIQFDSAQQQFLSRNAIILGTDPGAMYMVMRTLDPSTANSGWMRFGSDGFQEDHCTNNPGDGVYSGFGSNARKTLSTSGNAIVRTWHLAELHSNASEFSYYRNGGLVFTTGVNTVGWNATCQLAKSITLFWGGYMGQVVVYNAIHDAATRDQVRAALNAKWALY